MKNSSLLASNERILRKRFPAVFRRILDSGTTQSLDFRFTEKGGVHELSTIRGEHSFSTYGSGSRKDLLERWFEGLDLAKESLYAISGFGDASHLLHFLRNSSSGTYFLAAEKDPAFLREVLSRIDCSELLANDRFLLGVGEPDEDFFRDLQVAALREIQDVDMVVFSPLHSTDEAYYDKMRNELVRQYLVIRPLMEVNLRTATTIQSNTFKNLSGMSASPDVADLAQGMEDIPFVLVGAGPSLDESMEFLRNVQDRAIIVCSNSSLRKLVNNEIKPHLVVTADPQAPTLSGFLGVDLKGLTLACPFSAYPDIVRLFPGRVLSWCTFNPIVDLVKKFLGKPLGSEIMEKGTVSGCILDLSRLLGSRKVLFVGQDMCVRDDGRYYTDDSSYSDKGSHYSGVSQGHKLPGNTQDEVLVEARLFVYLKVFQQFISEQKGVEYRNLARTGVRIEGAPYLAFEEALNWIGAASSKPFAQRISQILADQVVSPDLTSVFHACYKHVEALFEKSLIAACKSEQLPPKYSGPNYSENKDLLQLLRDGMEINQLIEKDKGFWAVLFEGRTKSEIVQYRRKIRDIQSGNQNWAAVQRNKEFFWAISEGCRWLLSEMSQLFASESEASLSRGS